MESAGAVFCPGHLGFDKQIMIGCLVSTLIKTKTNCGSFNAFNAHRFVCFLFLKTTFWFA